MKKVMISQTMAGKTDEEIELTRQKAISVLESQGYEVIDTLFTDEWYSDTKMKERGVIQIPLCFLAKSLESMSLCDAVYFCNGWESARGCKLEHDAAVAYGLEIIYEEEITTKLKVTESCDSNYAKRLHYADKILFSQFPYNDKTGYNTIGNVDYEFPGNGSDSGKLNCSVEHIEDTPKVVKYLKKIGATSITVDKIRNRWGNYDVVKFNIECPESTVKESNYGGAYDIETSQYFTREEVTEFAESVVDDLSADYNIQFELSSCYVTDKVYEINIICPDGTELTASTYIDMRRISKHHDLMLRYNGIMYEQFRQQLNELI